MTKLFFTSLAVSALSLITYSQTPDPTKINGRGCGTGVPPAEWDTWFNNKVEEYKQNLASGKSPQSTIVIPVVVHVIYAGSQAVGTYPNISQAQINSQITVLNTDYAGQNAHVASLVSATGFSAVGAVNSNIMFCLAQKDPSGNGLAEPGIDRVSYVTKGWTNPASLTGINSFQSLIDGTIKPNTIWDPRYYFNIWITDVSTGVGIIGYSTFPPGTGLSGLTSNQGTMSNDGIWVWTKCFGKVGTLDPTYNLGGTASHETGHYLGLRHIGGDGNGNVSGDCSATDWCNDTPPQKGGNAGGQYGQNYGAPNYPLHVGTCTASTYGDMFMNFMDYVDDAKYAMFTPDQNTRFQTSLASSSLRMYLTASSATLCNVPPVSPSAVFSFVSTNDTICVDSNLVLNNTSNGLPGPTYLWSSSPAGNVSFSPSSSVQNPTLSWSAPGTYTITLLASNSAGNNTTTKTLVVFDCGNFDGITGYIREQNIFTLKPNPNNGIFTLRLNSGSGDSRIEICNSLGQVVYQSNVQKGNISELALDLSHLSPGLYNVQMHQSGWFQNKRLIIAR